MLETHATFNRRNYHINDSRMTRRERCGAVVACTGGDEIADFAARRLMTDGALRQSLSERARNRAAAHFDLEKRAPNSISFSAGDLTTGDEIFDSRPTRIERGGGRQLIICVCLPVLNRRLNVAVLGMMKAWL